MKRNAKRVHAVHVVVPIKDEELLLDRCIGALVRAIDASETVSRGRVDVSVTLVLDACTDRSTEIAEASPWDVLSVDFGNVGMARAAGIEYAFRGCDGADLAHSWIANTDADSAVPPNWLSAQIVLARSGADVMVGTVRPDPRDLSVEQQKVWDSTHVRGTANGHVHGANLGFRADVYRAAGGFAPVSEHEDVLLVEQLRRANARLVATDECWVLTSGRTVGRTPGGYAGYVRENLRSDPRDVGAAVIGGL